MAGITASVTPGKIWYNIYILSQISEKEIIDGEGGKAVFLMLKLSKNILLTISTDCYYRQYSNNRSWKR
jgi:hypothetical protein